MTIPRASDSITSLNKAGRQPVYSMRHGSSCDLVESGCGDTSTGPKYKCSFINICTQLSQQDMSSQTKISGYDPTEMQMLSLDEGNWE